jgi:hypothetical protein
MEASASTAVPLGSVGHVRCEILQSPEPWTADLDALVLSVGSDGLGSLGIAFTKAVPAARQTIAAAETPTFGAPTALTFDPNIAPSEALLKSSYSRATTTASDIDLRCVVLATTNDSDTPLSPESCARAAAAAIVTASGAGAIRLGIPLLGAGLLRLDEAEVARAVVPAVRLTVENLRDSTLSSLTFVTKDPSTTEAIRAAWNQVDTNVRLQMLADAPIADEAFDVLGYKAYAAALAFVIDHPETGTPLTLAINAPWGAGKTSLALLIQQRLENRPVRGEPPIVCWLNAWHHDDAPNIVSALAAVVARAADANRAWWRRLLDPLPTRLLGPRGRRRRHIVTGAFSLAAALVALYVSGAFEALTAGRATITALAAALPVVLQGVGQVRGTASAVGQMLRSPETALASGSLEEIRTDLGNLIHQATQRGRRRRAGRHRRLLVFIDDLERCQPARSIEVCEAVSSLLSHEDVVTILIGDMQTLATAAETKYKDLAPRYRTGMLSAGSADSQVGSFGELYLEKIVQFRFDLPTHDVDSLRRLAGDLVERSMERGTADDDDNEEAVPWLLESISDRTRSIARSLMRPYRSFVTDRRRRRQASEVERLLREYPQGDFPDEPTDDDEIGSDQDRIREMLEDQLSLRQIDGPYLRASYGAVAASVRPLPRDVKRLLNRLRFTLKLCADRELVAPRGPLSPAAIGKWALLSERWPDLQVAVSQDPELIARLEVDGRTVPGFTSAMAEIVPGYSRSAELYRLLITDPPLRDVAYAIARFRLQAPQDGVPAGSRH